MMKVLAGALAMGLLFGAASPAAAQQAGEKQDGLRTQLEEVVEQSGLAAAMESIAATAAPELERTFEQLSVTLSALAARLAGDPELRAAALRAAQGLSDVAQAVVVEQSAALQEALRAAAEQLADWSARQERAPAPR